MKKTKFLVCSLLCILAILGSLLVGCSGEDSSKGGNSKKEATLTLIGENGAQKEAVVKYDVDNTVETMYKSGYYFNGYYDAQEGGTQYFTKDGKSSSFWQEHYPTTLYAQFRPVNELSKTFDIMFSSKVWEIGISIDDATFVLPYEIVNAAQANLNLELEVNIQFRHKSQFTACMYIADGQSSSRETFFSTEVEPAEEYQYANIVARIPARCIRNGKLYILAVRRESDWMYERVYIKDMLVTISYTGNTYVE